MSQLTRQEMEQRRERIFRDWHSMCKNVGDNEDTYLTDTNSIGNIAKGWESLLQHNDSTKGNNAARAKRTNDSHRLFTKSTVHEIHDDEDPDQMDMGYDPRYMNHDIGRYNNQSNYNQIPPPPQQQHHHHHNGPPGGYM